MSQDENTQKLGGKWTIGEDFTSYGGDLYVNEENKSVSLHLIIPSTAENRLSLWPGTNKIPWISGKLVNGANIFLYNCHLGKSQTYFGSHRSQILFADYAFWGLKPDDVFKFIGARIDFGDVLGWYDLCKFEDLSYTDIELEFGYHWKKKEPYILSHTKNLTISFYPKFGLEGNIYDREMTLKQKVIAEFKYSREEEWEKILGDVKKIQYLISLGVGQKIEIESIEYLHHSHIYKTLDSETSNIIAGKVYCGTGKKYVPQKIRPYNYLFKLNDFGKIPDGMRNWNRNYQRIEPVFDLIFSVFDNNSSSVIDFLMLTQALETYHARFISSDIKKYIKLVDNLISELSSDSEKSFWRNYLIDNNTYDEIKEPKKNKKSKDYNLQLKNRIANLLYEGGNSIFQRNKIGIPSSNFAQRVADSRNYYTHYSEKLKHKSYTPEQLIIVNNYLLYLIFYHLMKFIGFPTDFVSEQISEILKKIRYQAQILNIDIWK